MALNGPFKGKVNNFYIVINLGVEGRLNKVSFGLKLYNNYSLLNVQFGSLLGPRGLLLIYMWGENFT